MIESLAKTAATLPVSLHRYPVKSMLGEPVCLAPESDVSHFDDGSVSRIAPASVAALAEHRGEHIDASRFRANMIVDGLEALHEERWIGRRPRIGSAALLVEMPSLRCVMINHATLDLPPQPGNLSAVGSLNGARPGVIARVVQPGIVCLGDLVDGE